MDHDDPLVSKSSMLNPYRYGARLILHRLLWDINPQSWRSRQALIKWRGKHKEEKAIILCNGPSLNKVDFELIDKANCFAFGLNKINLLFDRSSFRPNCIVAVNPFVIKQNKEYFNHTDIPLFIDSIGTRNHWVNNRNNIVFLHSGGFPNEFAKDCSMNINQGYTVTYVALQLAFHMGFREVALVGADHTFATKGPANKAVDGGGIDESHFDPRYFADVKWQLPDLFESEVAFTRAKNMFRVYDRNIFNCTVGGELDVFDRMNLEDFLSI